MQRPRFVASLALALPLACACASAPRAVTTDFGYTPLPLSQQIALREGWLAQRHARVLEMMRRHGVSMWMVVNEEFHDDPLTAWVAPPRPHAGGRDFFIFIDAGDKGLRKVAITGYAEESVQRFFETADEPKKPAEALAALVKEARPKTIALSIDGRRGVTHSLTRDAYQLIVQAIGAENEKKLIPAAPLIEEYLDTRLADEMAPYTELVRLTDAMVREAFSSRVIRPGATTVGEVRRFLYDALGRAGVSTWFEPDLRVQRQGGAQASSRGFLAVAREAVVIERGDLIHVDFGVTALGLNTDFQRMAYVLREGETDAPAGLKAALANTNAAQDELVAKSRAGALNADVYDAVMASLTARGIEAKIYSHPLGAQGHALGATIDFRAASRAEPPKALRAGSYLAMELNTATPIPEWGGQKAFLMEEDPVWLAGDGWRFFVPRQTSLFLIR